MKKLIDAVRKEAETVIEDLDRDDNYHNEQLMNNERKREDARERIKECDEALEAIAGAAKHLTGAK